MNRFDGKIALLTGAASGVGKATAIRLASEGAKVFGLDINAEGMEDTKATVEAAGGEMTCRVTDIGSVEECHAAAAACVETYGGIDVLGNIAGIANQRHVHQVTEAEWDLMNNVNLKGMFFLTQAALPHILERHGNIINIASNAGLMGQAYTVPYCATKGGVVNMTKALAMEFVKQPIRINAIAPGGIDTPLVHNFELQVDIDFALMQPYIGYRDASTAEQIAGLFAFVASDEGANIHGSIISADGGLTAS
ncbi:MAG: meso-butanediol dehydrogenase/(S,S)-butanediol dehydrogenase/diacetyl reductase [Candidatus Aldehydirespiratoraceae bacterium]